MIKAVLRLAIVGGLAFAILASWPDIQRYVKIRQVSAGAPHPDKVPAGGRTVYPQNPVDGEPDGTGDFDSAMRGGPARY
jgi:hypothetical protein